MNAPTYEALLARYAAQCERARAAYAASRPAKLEYARTLKNAVKARVYLDYNQMKGLVGGDFVSGLMNWARKGANVVHRATELGSKASSALKSIGLGEGGELIGSGQGGALARKSSLKDRLR